MASKTVTRYSVAKTEKSYGGSPIKGSTVYSETSDLRDAYHYGTSVGGDVSNGPAPDFDQLAPTS